MEKVALYARVSTDNQSIDKQLEKLREWATYKNLNYQTFEDDGVSAVAEKRPAFDYMIEQIENFDAVAVTELDRFGRSVNQLTSWTHDLQKKDVDLVVLNRNIDTSTTEGRLLFNILAAVAEFEREITRERLREGYREALKDDRVGRPKADLPVPRICGEYEEGAGVSYLANKYGVARSTIYRRLEEEGVK